MDEALRIQAVARRQDIRAGRLRGAALRELLLSVPVGDREVWVDELLGLPEAPPDVPNLPPGAVPYLPAGVDEILEMVEAVPLRPGEVLVDLGAGLGRVAVLAHLVSGARARGVEIQEPLVRLARDCAAELRLSDVEFIHGNAADVEPDGSVFFLYAPFTGATLQKVLGRLERLSQKRQLTVCAVWMELPGERWLRRRLSATASPSLAIYDSLAPSRP